MLCVSEVGMVLDEVVVYIVVLGYLVEVWVGNCVVIGYVVSVFELLILVLMMMLQCDIEWFLELILIYVDFGIECCEFNWCFWNDVEYVVIFYGVFIIIDSVLEIEYWWVVCEQMVSGKLDCKFVQFFNWGFLISFDLELFNEEDWIIVYWGMG